MIQEESRFLSEGIPWPEKLIFETMSGKIDIPEREERSDPIHSHREGMSWIMLNRINLEESGG